MQTKHTPGPWVAYRMGYSSSSYYVRAASPRHGGPKLHGSAGAIAKMPPSQFHDVEANTRLISVAPELLAEIEREYEELADITNEWPGRNTEQGQAKLCRLRDLISKATGREAEEVQDDYCSRAISKKGI